MTQKNLQREKISSYLWRIFYIKIRTRSTHKIYSTKIVSFIFTYFIYSITNRALQVYTAHNAHSHGNEIDHVIAYP